MRPLIFRAWLPAEKEYVENEMDLVYSIKCNAFMFDNDNIDLPSNVILEQWTGEKDKNGKKIFEGDILFLVKTKKYTMIEWGKYGSKSRMVGFEFGNNESNEVIVVGNFRQNPELLRKLQ